MDILKKISRIHRLNIGDVLLDLEGNHSDMFVVIDGLLRIDIHNTNSFNKAAEMNVTKGAFFGGLELLEHTLRVISVTAEKPSVVMHIPYKQVEEYRRYLRHEGEAFYESLYQKVERFNEVLRSVELEYIRKIYQPKKFGDHSFFYDPKLAEVSAGVLGSEYVLMKKFRCPVCLKEFETEAIRTSRLRLIQRGDFFVSEYRGVEPLWFDIVICPSCHYPERIEHFEEDWNLDIEKVFKVLLDIKANIMFSYSKSRTAQEVINAYMIYEKCLEAKGAHASVVAKSSLLIAEVFHRIEFDEMAEVYYEKAFGRYKTMIDAGVLDVDDFQMQQLYIILGKLYERRGMKDEAIDQYKKAKMMYYVSDKRYTNIAESHLFNLTCS